VKRLKALTSENAKLKKLLVERDLEIEVMKEINRKNGEPARSSRAVRLYAWAKHSEATRLRAHRHGSPEHLSSPPNSNWSSTSSRQGAWLDNPAIPATARGQDP